MTLNNDLRIFFWVTAICLGLFLGFQYLFPILTPFLFGILLACLIEPVIKQAETGLGINRKLAVSLVLAITLLLLLSLTGIVFLVSYQEAIRILPKIPILVNKLLGLGEGLTDFLVTHFQVPDGFFQNYLARPDAIEGLFRSTVSWVVNLVPVFPKVLLALGLGGITAYFISRDKKFFSGLFYENMPHNWRPLTIQVKEEVIAAFISFIRAEILLAVLTSVLTALIFWLLKIPGAIAYGFLAGVLDFIPVVGPGMLYLPLIFIFCLFKNYYQAVWLVILYFLVLFLRQLGEAKLIGENLQIHPLAVIFLVYLGMKLFGLTGILFGPILVIMLRAVFRALRFRQATERLNSLI